MEKNILQKYLNRPNENIPKKAYPGPVITISREYGCYATEIAQKLTEKINKELNCPHWQYVTKEILTEAAQNLHVNQKEIAHLFGAEEKSFLGDLVVSFGRKKYASDALIKKTIKKVVRTYAESGFAIIVGRAGCVIAEDITKSLHVKIVAPKEWRVDSIARRFELLKSEAEKQVEKNDANRNKFMEFYSGNRPDSELFHASFNHKCLNSDQIANAIFYLAKQKTLFLK